MSELTQTLSPDLLIEILGHVSVQDILRLKQVNRVFRDVILTSGLIQHRIDLFAAGFEHNAAAGISLTDSRKALLKYESNPYSLVPVGERAVDGIEEWNGRGTRAAGGVFAVLGNDSVRLVSPGSASRGIQHEEWEIPRPTARPLTEYCFDPGADVIAFVEPRDRVDMQLIVHLRRMSDGGYHPDAQCPTIHYSRSGATMRYITVVSITSSRLMVLASGNHLVVWDWRSAWVLFELDEGHYRTAEFADDYTLLLSLEPTRNAPPYLIMMDTLEFAGGPPIRTSFRFSDRFKHVGAPYLLLERGAHKPTPAESSASFHRDPTQRIAVLCFHSDSNPLVLLLGDLLKLLKSCEGSDIGWNEWKTHVIALSTKVFHRNILVSGCRLFFIYSTPHNPGFQMKVYDFSVQGRARYLSEWPNEDFDVGKHITTTEAKVRIPWAWVSGTHAGHDSIIFTHRRFTHEPFYLQIWTY